MYLFKIDISYVAKNSLQKQISEFIRQHDRRTFQNKNEALRFREMVQGTVEHLSAKNKRCKAEQLGGGEHSSYGFPDIGVSVYSVFIGHLFASVEEKEVGDEPS